MMSTLTCRHHALPPPLPPLTPAACLHPPLCPCRQTSAQNSLAKRVLSSASSLRQVFDFLSSTLEKQSQRAELRNLDLRLVPADIPHALRIWFGDPVMSQLQYGVGAWPYRFMTDEVTMAVMFCVSANNAVLDGPARADALLKFKYLGDKLNDVETVALVVENRDGTDLNYAVLGMKDGSHVCSCRTLQVLGVCCRHFWAAMRLSPKYRFHVGILNEHWLAERGRKPANEWPDASKPRWAVALNHGALNANEVPQSGPGEGPGKGPGESEGGVVWDAGNETIQSSLLQLKETGPTPQDKTVLYVDCVKEAQDVIGIGVDVLPPETLRALVQQFRQGVTTAAQVAAAQASSGREVLVGNPHVVRLPSRSRDTGKRKRGSWESGPGVGAATASALRSYRQANNII